MSTANGKRAYTLGFGILLVLLLTLAAACTREVEVPGETVVVEKEVIKEVQVPGETVVVEKEVVKTVEVEKEVVREVEAERFVTNVWGQVVDRPQYGGTIPVSIVGLPEHFDAWYGGGVDYWTPYVLDELGTIDFSLPQDEFDTTAGYYDINYMTGELAESWEIASDVSSFTFQIRENVNWHNKAPMNGRQLNAHDVAHHFQRMWGVGDFAAAGGSPHIWGLPNVPAEAAEATADFEFKVSIHTPGLDHLGTILGILTPSDVHPPEVIEQFGDMRNWEVVVGTGPYGISDFVPGASLEFERNPDYWKTDPRYPDLDLQIPYADKIELRNIPDLAARVAALRTGKTVMQGGQYLTVDQVNSLRRSNPELTVVPLVGTSKTDGSIDVSIKPFDDKNVRIALQKAINLVEINFTYYNGVANPVPMGFAPLVAKGYFVPYEEWPDDLKWQYEYDPMEAERLLDEAGYSRGGDGVRFSAQWDMYPPWGADVDLAQLLTGYWAEVGIDISLNVVADGAEIGRRRSEQTYDGLSHCGCRHKNANPLASLPGRFKGTPSNYTGITDTVFNELIERAWASTDYEEMLALAREADMYFIREHWSMMLPIVPQTMLVQPWLKDYTGQEGGGDEAWASVMMWTWIDQELRDKMGH